MTKEEMKRELGSLIWKTATSLVHGGKVSPVQFMDYMIGALFYRFISENITNYSNRLMRESGAGDVGQHARLRVEIDRIVEELEG